MFLFSAYSDGSTGLEGTPLSGMLFAESVYTPLLILKVLVICAFINQKMIGCSKLGQSEINANSMRDYKQPAKQVGAHKLTSFAVTTTAIQKKCVLFIIGSGKILCACGLSKHTLGHVGLHSMLQMHKNTKLFRTMTEAGKLILNVL